MIPWLQNVVGTDPDVHPWLLAARLALALLLGMVVAAIYRRTSEGELSPSFRATLVLLTILIAAVTQVIGDNVARAFSLVGALAIVRFRTVVQDTRDTAFVIFAVTVGMAVGAGDLWVAGFSLVIVGVAAAIMAPRSQVAGSPSQTYQMSVSLALGRQPDIVVAPLLEKHASHFHVIAVSTANRGASLESVYHVRLRPESTPAALVDELNEREGVQSVQIRLLDSPGR